ncbi:GNAT family N-acetyltransferase [Marispirochaeta aestuarii]|uniref:GNAT family N-acetyltransferase n=1 Tax=Marispirochaeta aestuarii TaxID=1963862 RepID=UPI0029C86E5A|nr:GNAT family N-acetyltransferase [Marispirochaeta aestuarii]
MLRPCHQGYVSVVSDFLLAHEELWTALTDRLFLKGRLRPARKLEDLYLLEGSHGIRGLIYHEAAGFTFPAVIPPLDTVDMDALGEALRSFGKITTLMGNSRVIDVCTAAVGRAPAYRVDYLHMVRPCGASCFSAENPVPREVYEHLKPGQVREVYPLQRAYEIEEVLLEPEKFNPLICMNHLREALKKQQIYGTRINGSLAAKAGTNALGANWVQLGGIFTLPGFRGRGVARRLMARLLENLDEQGLGSTLFVKPENIPAVSLYRRVGFTDTGPFSIAYYLR